MTTIHSLPYELLVNIFERLDSPSQAAECSLVCKMWHDPAVKAMLGYTIFIDSNETIYNLVQIFAKDPAKAKFVKHIKFGFPVYDYQWLHVFLLHTLHRNLESLSGSLHTTCLAILLHCVQSAPSGTLCKMKTVAITDKTLRASIQSIQTLSLCFRETLETLQLVLNEDQYWNFVDELTQFTRLKHIYFDGYINQLCDLNKILDNCQHLEHFTTMYYWAWDDSDDTMEHYDAMVGRKHNLKTLTIDNSYIDCYASLLKYFVPQIDFRVQYSLVGFPDQSRHREEALAYVKKYYDRVTDITIGNNVYLKIENFT
ncbi:hypothetical protein MBANPS3_010759 [Mucor bainieri]